VGFIVGKNDGQTDMLYVSRLDMQRVNEVAFAHGIWRAQKCTANIPNSLPT